MPGFWQPAIVLAEYQQKEAEKAVVEKIKAEKAAFQKQEAANVELRKALAKVQREAKAKVRKEAVVRPELEKVEGLKKCSWDEEVEIVLLAKF